MRLLKIGRDPQCNIVLHSDKVSSLHAELTLLDSGDIQLEDKNSHNGTYIMNQRIQPGKPVNVRRGDAIRFADVELQWSQVPMPEDNSAYKAIYGVGSNFNNELQISGATVSRYHATIKLGRDNKMYIVDHSKNGTTVDGVKISSNMPVRIKRKSAVVCGGVPVDTSRLPWPSEAWKTILTIAAVVAIVAGAAIGIWKVIGTTGKANLQSLQNATACVVHQYYIDVIIDDDPFVDKINGWPDKWQFGVDNHGNLKLGTLTSSKISPINSRGTAFFISDQGEMGTNRHIAVPWLYLDNEVKDQIRQTMQFVLTNENSSVYQSLIGILQQSITSISELVDAQARLQRLNKSAITISGETEYMGVILAGSNFTTIADLFSCQVIATTDDERKDVALIRLNSKATPAQIVKGGFFDIENARVDELSLRPQEDELTIIGYPAQYGIADGPISKGTEILPTVHRTYISKMPDDDMFQIQSNVVGGQSGSPIVDKKHRLVGVVNASHRGTDVAYGCNIKHLKELYEKNKARNQ